MKVNEDSITTEQIHVTYVVLEQLRKEYDEDEMADERDLINEAHCLVQEYDKNSEWRDQ